MIPNIDFPEIVNASEERGETTRILEFGPDGLPIPPILILANRNGDKIGSIQNVSDCVYRNALNDVDEISFNVDKVANGETCAYWDDIKDFRLIYIQQFDDWFEINVNVNEDDETVKSITGLHLQESELSQRLIFETEINTEGDIARDDYQVTVFYNESNPKASLLNRILADKGQDYEIIHVDASLKRLQRTFSFNNKSIKDCFDEVAKEIGCLFVYGEHPLTDGKIHRTISAYDLLDYCNDCGERGDFTGGVCTNCGSDRIVSGYGEDTNIFISKENIATSVTLSSNASSVKNCFRLEAGDDVMTAVIRSCSPSGSQYIWRFSDETKNDMSPALSEKLSDYDAIYNEYKSSRTMNKVPSSSVNLYNSLVNKYRSINSELEEISYPIDGTDNLLEADYKARYLYDYLDSLMMPGGIDTKDTSAQLQILYLTTDNLSPIGVGSDRELLSLSTSTVDSAVTTYCKVYVDTRYKITISNSSYSSGQWRGNITVTSYTNEEDTATVSNLRLTVNTQRETYIRQAVDKIIKRNDSSQLGAVALFHKSNEDFANALKLHCKNNLETYRDICNACISVLIDQGLGSTGVDLYTKVYLPYHQKSQLIENELALREKELSYLLAPTDDAASGLIDYIEQQRNKVHASLDMYTYLGDELWSELMSFRRDDSYTNQNFISDGMNDSELIDNARQFYKNATKEIIKASTLQYSLRGKLQNFLLMPEFEPLYTHFYNGNKIHLMVDDKVFMLRLTAFEIDYDNIQKIDIEFSDVLKIGDILTDVGSILDQARSIASSYDTTMRQAQKGNKANLYYLDIATKGLDLTNKKIVNEADNQNLVYDKTGLLMRRKSDFTEEYSLEQVKIINQGLYYTRDNWRTVSTGIGHFKYYDPETQEEKDGYGVIADTVVGNLILGNDLRIYNESGSMILNEDGSIFTVQEGEDNSGVFKIRRKNTNGSYSDILYIDNNGKIIMHGASIEITSGKDLPTYIEEIVTENAGSLVMSLSSDFIGISTDNDGNNGNYANAQVYIDVKEGRKDITYLCEYTVSASTGIIGEWDLNTHTYRINDMTVDSGTITFTIRYKDIEASKVSNVQKIKDGLNGESAISVEIESTNGNLFKNGAISTQLICRVYQGTEDITDTVAVFDWYRTLPDGTRDQTWNRLGAGNIINITSADVISKSTFKCNVTI